MRRENIKPDLAIENAKCIGTVNQFGNAVVHVKDNGMNVVISKNGVKHSLDRRLEVVAPVAIHTGEILQNAIQINKLNPREDTIRDSYVLIGAAKNKRNEPYLVSFVVNRHTSELMDINVLYSISAKKEPAGLIDPSMTARDADYFTGSDISIAQLLDFVNEYYPDLMPEDVLKHYGHTMRPTGVLG